MAYDRTPSLHTPQSDEAIKALEAWNQRDTIGSVAMSINTQWIQALDATRLRPRGRRAVRGRQQEHDFTARARSTCCGTCSTRTQGLVPCDRLCAKIDYFGGKPDEVLVAGA